MLGLRCINKDGTSYGGFKNSTEVGAIITAPDWKPTEKCGNGIHFWPYGIGREGKEHSNPEFLWQVVEPIGEVVKLDGKAKAKSVKVIFTGSQAEAMKILIPHQIEYIKASGNKSSAATSGYKSSAATSGRYSSAATSGCGSSAATSGYGSSAATSGDSSSAATFGVLSPAIVTGNYGKAKCGPNAMAAVLGVDGMVMGGENSILTLGYMLDGKMIAKSEIVGITLKPNVWYELDANNDFKECVC